MKFVPEIQIIVHPEDIPIKGNVQVIDDEEDARAEQAIQDELDRGNRWAWCCVEVRAEFRGLTGTAILGGCSYESEEDFKAPGGYFDDLRTEATDELRDLIADLQGCEIE